MGAATTATITDDALTAFRAVHRGPIITPVDSGYEPARRIWNAMIEKRPALISSPTGTADVIACIAFARDHRLPLAIRGGGHNVAGHALSEGGLVIDLRGMRNVSVDPTRRRAWVGGGCTLGDIDRETQVHGLAAPLGVVSQTGVAGLTLHGGLGYLRRKHGMACDAVRTFEVVTADGRVVRADTEMNADLFWALKGGGGNFGVVTGFEFELYPIGPQVVQLGAMYPLEEARDLIPVWRDFMQASSPHLVCNCLLWSMPHSEMLPETVRGRDVCIFGGCWTGQVAEGLQAIEPLRRLSKPLADLSGELPFVTVQSGFDPFFVEGELNHYWKSAYADALDDGLIELLCTKAKARPDPNSIIAIWHMGGGAMAQVGSHETAFGDRSHPWTISIDTSWRDPAQNEAAIAWTRALWGEVRARSRRGGGYVNFAGLGEEGDALLRASFGDANYERLRAIKRAWDPQNLFRENLNIPPN